MAGLYTVVRSAAFGQIINYATNGRIFGFAEQHSSFLKAEEFIALTENDDGEKKSGVIIVDWYSTEDCDKPSNWTRLTKWTAVFSVCFLTFSMYINMSTYTTSIPGIMEEFGVSHVKAMLGLSLCLVTYGVGPLLWGPLAEVAGIGQVIVYNGTLFVAVCFTIGAAASPTFGGILVFRTLVGWFGSTAMGIGGATMVPMFQPRMAPYLIGLWAAAATCGPVVGPVMGGFAAQNVSWRLPLYLLVAMGVLALVTTMLFLPETAEKTILLRRARHLRILTGDDRYQSQSEIDAKTSKTPWLEIMYVPIRLSFEPAILYSNIYLGVCYGIFYLWFESFPIVYGGIYGFSEGMVGIAFICIIIAQFSALGLYFAYQYYYVEPRIMQKIASKGIMPAPEIRLELGLIACCFMIPALFLFGWSSRVDVHWVASMWGAGLYTAGIYWTFQSVLVYLATAYSGHMGAVLAANDAWRSCIAAAFPLFGHGLFANLNVGPGCSLLAGLVTLLTPFLLLIRIKGGSLRRRSTYAFHQGSRLFTAKPV